MASGESMIEGWSLALPLEESLEEGRAQAVLSKPGAEAQSTAALTALVQTYSPLLFRVANSVLRSPAESEDVVQDAFLRVLELRNRRSEALDEVRDMRLWLVRIAWNLALTRRRRIRPDQMDEIFASSLAGRTVPADQLLAEAQRMTAVLRELDRLPRPEHHVLLLSAVEELGTSEIAAVLGKSESAVRALLFRARTRLRERLAQKPSRSAGKGGTR